MALVFYHRGLKLRPELQEFRLGIQKAQEAIDNSVGSKLTRILFPNATDFREPITESKTTGSNMSQLQRRKSDWSLSRVFPFTYSSTAAKAKSSHVSAPSSYLRCAISQPGKSLCFSHSSSMI